jgi:hypothetical protein
MSVSVRQGPLPLKKPPVIVLASTSRDLRWFWRQSFKPRSKRQTDKSRPMARVADPRPYGASSRSACASR